MSQFAEPEPADQTAKLHRAYEDHEVRPTQPDEAHGMYVEGELALLRFVRGLESTYRRAFDAIDRVNAIFPDAEHPVADRHVCSCPTASAGTWMRWECRDCGAKWYHRGTEWWPE